jgi:hypothetical protein
LSYDRYCWAAGASTAVDLEGLAVALTRLATEPTHRRRMGTAGQARARSEFAWPVIYRRYQALWAEQEARRKVSLAAGVSQPPMSGARLDPLLAFGHYPSVAIGPATRIARRRGSDAAEFLMVLSHPLFQGLPTPLGLLEALFALTARDQPTLHDAARQLEANPPAVLRAAGVLAEAGLVVLA